MRFLPPVKSIVYFESVARHQSFKKAAEELFVTPSAVSHQISSLESFFNKSLLKREGRRVSLTDCGLRYFSRISPILNEIASASIDLGSDNPATNVKIIVPPSLLKNWLLPRLNIEKVYQNNINLEFVDSTDTSNLSKSNIDLAIHYGLSAPNDMKSDFLFTEQMVAVCSPGYPNHRNGRLSLDTLAEQSLIYTSNRLVQWDGVLAALGKPSNRSHKKLFFKNSIQAMASAANGHGLAYVNQLLAQRYLQEGSLVIPFDIPINPGQLPCYYLACSNDAYRRPEVALLYAMILKLK